MSARGSFPHDGFVFGCGRFLAVGLVIFGLSHKSGRKRPVLLSFNVFG